MPKTEVSLAVYKNISDYVPAYGDFVIWTGWFVTWCGVVSNYAPGERMGDNNTLIAKLSEEERISIIFSTMSFLLFTMTEKEQKKNTRILNLDKIRNSANGVFAISQHDYVHNVTVWYI